MVFPWSLINSHCKQPVSQIHVLFPIFLWLTRRKLRFLGILIWLWTPETEATVVYCIVIGHCHFCCWEIHLDTDRSSDKNVQTTEKVQVSVWNIICSQLPEIEANQASKKKIGLKFYTKWICIQLFNCHTMRLELSCLSQQTLVHCKIFEFKYIWLCYIQTIWNFVTYFVHVIACRAASRRRHFI